MVDSIDKYSSWNMFKGRAALKKDEIKMIVAPPSSGFECTRKMKDIQLRKDEFKRTK